MEQLKKYSPLFVFQLAFVVLMYWPTAGAGFVTDEIGWFTTYNQLDWGGLLHAFNDKSFHFVYHLFGFAFWKLLGFNGNAWMVAVSSLHALNATLLFVAFNKLFEAWMPGFAHQAALASSFLFLISPYHTEPLVWYACVHYTVCGGLLLSSLILLLKYLERQKKASLLYFYVPFGIACFTLELSFTWPFVFGLIVLFAPNDERSVTDRIKLTLRIAAPTLGMVILYFAVNKFLRGSFVGHYGASTHLNADPILLGSNLAKYAAKLFGSVS